MAHESALSKAIAEWSSSFSGDLLHEKRVRCQQVELGTNDLGVAVVHTRFVPRDQPGHPVSRGRRDFLELDACPSPERCSGGLMPRLLQGVLANGNFLC